MNITKIGISKCLTGEKVRYDGQAQRDSFLMDTLSKFVEYTPVCPEADCGLSIPREAMRLVGDVDNPRLMTIKTKQDMTSQMNRWIKPALKDLAGQTPLRWKYQCQGGCLALPDRFNGGSRWTRNPQKEHQCAGSSKRLF